MIGAGSGLETLKASLGIASIPSGQPLEARDKAAFQQVGMQAWQALEGQQAARVQAITPMMLQQAARDYLCSQRPQASLMQARPGNHGRIYVMGCLFRH